MIYITYTVTFILLVFYSVLDMKHREISAWLLYSGTAVVLALGIVSRVMINIDVIQYIVMLSAIYGVIWLMARNLQKWVGEADFDVIFMIYLAIGVRNLIIFSFSIFAVSGLVYAWLAMRKSGRDKRIPLIPVLTAAYAMTMILGGSACW